MSWASPPSSRTAQVRRAQPSHQPWVPLPYMLRGVGHLATHRAAGLPLKPGGRKTSITLAAFLTLQAQGTARNMLVIAPLRVCRQVWRQEAAKWTPFRHLKFGLLHGPKKDEVLRKSNEFDICLINPEGVAWLCKHFAGRNLPWDVVAIDELTRFKNHQSERSKALRPRIDKTPWRWGLTGSLAPNGYMDLFGQQLVLDGGAALGRYITHYRDQYFTVDWNGFDYSLQPGAEKRITARLAPYWMTVDEKDYSQLPPLVDNPIYLELDKPARATYERMKKDMLAELPDGIVTASNQAACYSKLSQMANGCVYVGDRKQSVSHIHDLKLDAIEELLEELNGEPLLVGYEFNHDLDRLIDRFGKPDPKTGKKVLPYLGKGTTSKQEDAWISAWNRGELPLLCAHPASAGHGLNMQEANACNVAWFGITWDFELYDQFIRRVWRSGNEATQVFNHLLIVRGTIDELKLEALRDKDMTQMRLLSALNTQVLREIAETQGAGDIALDDRRLPMVARLSTQNGSGHAAAPAPVQETAAPITPKGWGAPKPNGQTHVEQLTGGAGHPDQRQRIQEQIAPAEAARAAFSGAVGQQTEAIRAADYGPAATQGTQQVEQAPEPATSAPTTRRRRSSAAQGTLQDKPIDVTEGTAFVAAVIAARTEVLKVAFSDPQTTLEEGLEIARSLMEFVTGG